MGLRELLADQDAAIAEAENDIGTRMTWVLADVDKRIPIVGIAGGNAFIVRKSVVESLSPGRPPENGDQLIDTAGNTYQITQANGGFDSLINGGFTMNNPRNTDAQAFYRLVYGGENQP